LKYAFQDLNGGKPRVNSQILFAIREVGDFVAFVVWQAAHDVLQWAQKQMVAVLSKMPEQDRVFSNVHLQCASMNYVYRKNFKKSADARLNYGFFEKCAEAREMIRESLEARRLKV
jgi:hypothetical protein